MPKVKHIRGGIRKRLAADLAVRHDLPVTAVRALIRDLFIALGDELATSRRVEVRGFGIWELVPARHANLRDPRTGLPCPPTSPVDVRFMSSRGLAKRCGALRCRHRLQSTPRRSDP